MVNVALPFLQSTLHTTLADVQWVVESYALFLAVLLLTGGSLGDLYGRRKIFLIGVSLIAAASACCGLALDVQQLIVARGLQGVGAALLVPGSLALISVSFPRKERGRAIGTWAAISWLLQPDLNLETVNVNIGGVTHTLAGVIRRTPEIWTPEM